jgi:phosphoglycolate phosphatase
LAQSTDGLAGAVIALDLDGTLVDTAPDLIAVLNQILAELGHAALPLAAARSVIGHGARAMLSRGFDAAGEVPTPVEMDRLFDRFIDLYVARIAAESRPYPGVEDALDSLAAAGARLAVCTNKRTDLSLMLLGALGLKDRFAAIVGPDLAGARKPDPKHLLAAIAAAGGEARRALMVGDSRTDLDAARAAGTPVALVTFGYTETPAADLQPDALIDRFADLPAAAMRLLQAPAAAISPVLPRPADA